MFAKLKKKIEDETGSVLSLDTASVRSITPLASKESLANNNFDEKSFKSSTESLNASTSRKKLVSDRKNSLQVK